MLIREPRATDFEDVVETYFSFFPEAQADASFGLTLFRERPSLEDERKVFVNTLKEVGAGTTVSQVAEVDSRVVGWCDVRGIRPGTPLDHRGTLGICIRKEFRGQGIGEALMKATLEKCKGRFEMLELTALANNRGAIRLYERFGFRRFGVLPGAVKRAGRYFDDDFMYLKL